MAQGSADTIASNPLVNMGVDLATEIVGSVAQELVRVAANKLTQVVTTAAGGTDAFYSSMALAVTAQVEVMMELARGNARLIVRKTQEKEEVIEELQGEVTALNNAIQIILNSRPFFSEYQRQLIQAFTKIDSGNTKLKSVTSTLKAVKFYNDREFERAFTLLEEARDLILPDRSAKVDEIRSGNILEGTLGGMNAQKALAAALSIPGITANIARLMVRYSNLTFSINGLIFLYLNALNEFISAFKRNETLDKLMINFLETATDQLDPLLGDMAAMLFPADGRDTQITYPAQVTAAATKWGVQLVPIIEWLRISPNKAQKQLNLTGESVRRYNLSVARIEALSDRRVGLATLKVEQGAEDLIETVKAVTNVLITANTVVATQRVPRDVVLEVKQLKNLLDASRGVCFDLRSALTPFINTPNNLIAGANGVIANLSKLASDLGLDRVAELMAIGDVASLMTISAETATFAGAAVGGLNAIIKKLNDTPTATDQDKQKVELVRDEYNRIHAAKKVESLRGVNKSTSTYLQERTARFKRLRKQAKEATVIATKYEVEAVANDISKLDEIADTLAQITGNKFGFL